MDDRLIARFSRVIFAAMLFREQGLKKFSTPSVDSERYYSIIWQEMRYKYHRIRHHLWLSHELKSLSDFIAFDDVCNIRLSHLRCDSWLTCRFPCSPCRGKPESCTQLSLLVRRLSLIYREELKSVEQNHRRQAYSGCSSSTILSPSRSWQSCMRQNSEWMDAHANIVSQEKCCV